jgi:hypothetical protein
MFIRDITKFFHGPCTLVSMFMSSSSFSSSLQTNAVKSSLVLQELSYHFSQLLHGNMSDGIHFLLGLTATNFPLPESRKGHLVKQNCTPPPTRMHTHAHTHTCPSPAKFFVKCLDIRMRRCPINSCMCSVILYRLQHDMYTYDTYHLNHQQSEKRFLCNN